MTNMFIIIVALVFATVAIYILYAILLATESKGSKFDLQLNTKDIFEQVKILYDQKEYAIVEMLAKKYLEKVPSHMEVRSVLAKTYQDCHKYNEAIKELLIILNHDPNNLIQRSQLATCYRKNKNYVRAIDEWNKILKRDENDVVAIRNLAEIYGITRQRQYAINMYEKLIEFLDSNSDIARTYNTLADLYVELDDYPKAFDALKNILAIYPNDLQTKKRLIALYLEIKNKEKAIETLESILSSIETEEDKTWAFDTLIDLYMDLDMPHKALEFANQMLSMSGVDERQIREKIARINVSMGNYDIGIEMLTKLSGETRNNLSIKKELAAAYEGRKDFSSAVKIYKEILDIATIKEARNIHHKMSNLYVNWGLNLFENDDREEAFKMFTMAIQYDNTNPTVYYNLGLANMKIKNYSEAITQLAQAKDLDRFEKVKYCEALAICNESIDNMVDLKKVLVELIAVEPKHAIGHYKLALLCEGQRDIKNAVMYYKKAIELDGTLVDAKYRLALIYEAQSLIDDAINLYEDIVKLDPNHEFAKNNLNILLQQ